MHAILSSQTYGGVDPGCVKAIRSACFHAANHGLTWEMDVSADRMGYGPARNYACDYLLAGLEAGVPIDGIMWIDSDIRPPQDAITRLLATTRRYNLDFTCGIYHQRGGDYLPVIYEWAKEGGTWGYKQCSVYPPGDLSPQAGCGFGFVWTATNVIVDISKLKKFDRSKRGGWFPDDRDQDGFGEDLGFCNMATEAGYQLYADTGVQVGHLGEPEVVTLDTLNRHVAKLAATAKTV